MFMVGNKSGTSIFEVNYYFLMFSASVVILHVIESMFSLFPGNKVNIFVQPVAWEDQHFVMILQFVRCGGILGVSPILVYYSVGHRQ